MLVDGKVAIVTASAGAGAGQATARILLKEGAMVTISDKSERRIAETMAELQPIYGKRVQGVRCDVTQPQDVQQLVDSTLKAYGRVDVLVNNAGYRRMYPLQEMPDDEWNMVQDINLKGSFYCCRAVAPSMIGQGYGRIVNISSASALLPFENECHYEAAKAGLLGFTRGLAKELGKHNITVNAVLPGTVWNPHVTKTTSEDLYEQMRQITPLQRLGKPEDIAKVVLFLASELGDFVTGQSICVSGGLYMH